MNREVQETDSSLTTPNLPQKRPLFRAPGTFAAPFTQNDAADLFRYQNADLSSPSGWVGSHRVDLQLGEVQQQACESAAGERPENGDGRVAPVGSALAGDGQEGMRQTRTEIAGGVDGVAGGAAERKTDSPYQAGYKPLANTRSRAIV